MHIVVCVKQVPDTSEVKIDPATNTLDRSSAPAIINPYDAHAVAEAVALRKRCGGRISIVTMGPPQATEVIRKCIEMGADEGYLLSDRVFAGSDTLATSYILTTGIRKISSVHPVDIVLCGKQAIDGDTAQVGPGIATRLEIPQLTYVDKIPDVDIENGQITVHRRIDDGYEVVSVKLPCLITVEKEINELLYPTLPDMIRAARYKPQILSVADMDAADTDQMGLKGSPTSVWKIFPPPRRPGGQILTGSAAEAVSVAVDGVMRSGIIKLAR